MRAVTKALGAIITVAALAAAGPVAASAATASQRGPGGRRRRRPGGHPGRLHLRNRQLADVRRAQQPVPRARHLGPLRRLHRHGRELGPHGRVQDRQLPRLVSDQQRAGQRQLHQVPPRHRHRRLLVHGRPRRRPALERHRGGGHQVGRRPGGGRARGDEEAQRHLPGGVGRHRAAGDRAGPRQRLEQRLLLALQRARRCRPPSPRPSTGRTSTASRTTSPSHSTYKVGVYSSAPVWNSIFGTGSAGSIPNTYEWTYLPETTTVDFSTQPTGWCLHASKTCAQFFGGQSSSSKYALMWQWSGGGGITNKLGLRLRPDRRRADEVTPPR